MLPVTQADYDAVIAKLPSLPLDEVQAILDDTASMLMEAMTQDPRETALLKECEAEIARREKAGPQPTKPNIRLATNDGVLLDPA